MNMINKIFDNNVLPKYFIIIVLNLRVTRLRYYIYDASKIINETNVMNAFTFITTIEKPVLLILIQHSIAPFILFKFVTSNKT